MSLGIQPVQKKHPNRKFITKIHQISKKMDRFRGKVAIVTGASAGIGAAVAKSLVEEGLLVVGFARRAEKVEELAKTLAGAKGKLYAVKADVSNEQETLGAFEWVTKNVGPVHVLVNNAGVLYPTSLIEGETEKWRKILEVNVLGLSICTREAVKIMRANNIDGHIVHIGSVVGHILPDLPMMSVYPSSKHAVKALTEVLRQELKREGLKIKISEVSPGRVDTEIAREGVSPEFFGAVDNQPFMLQSEDVAQAVVNVLNTPPHVQVHTMILKPILEPY